MWYDCDVWHTSAKQQYSHTYFSFFKNFDFLGHKSGKRTEIAQNQQKACPDPIRATACDMIVIFGTVVGINNISTHVYFDFWKFWFSGPQIGWKGENGPQSQEACPDSI